MFTHFYLHMYLHLIRKIKMGSRFSDKFILFKEWLNEACCQKFCIVEKSLEEKLNIAFKDEIFAISLTQEASQHTKKKNPQGTIEETVTTLTNNSALTYAQKNSTQALKRNSQEPKFSQKRKPPKREILANSIIDRLLFAYKTTVEIHTELFTDAQYICNATKKILYNLQTANVISYFSKPSKPSVERSIDEEVPLVDLSTASLNDLMFLLQLFTNTTTDETEITDSLEAVSKFIPHIKIQKLPDPRFNQSRCLKCSINLHECFCQVCEKVFCRYCINKRKIPQFNMFTPNSVCDTCYQTLDSQDAKTWVDEGLKLINSKSIESIIASHGYFTIALCYDFDKTKLLYDISKTFLEAQHPEIALKYITNLLNDCDDKTSIKALLLASSILKTLAFKPKRKFPEQWTLLKSAECACDEAELVLLHLTTTCNYKLDVPDISERKREIMEAAQSLYTNQKEKFDLDTLTKIHAAWKNRNFTELLLMITSKESMVVYFKDSFISMLENFMNTQNQFLPSMLDEDATALSFLRGLLQMLKGESKLAMDTLEETIWKKYHAGWMQQAAIDIILALDFSLPHKRINSVTQFLNADYLLSADTEKLSVLIPNIDKPYEACNLKLYWPNFYLVGVNTKATRKYEQATLKQYQQGKWNEWEVGLAYLDFVPSCQHSAEYCICLLTAGFWFLKVLQKMHKCTADKCYATTKSSEKVKETYAVKRAILKCAQVSLCVSSMHHHPGMQLYVCQSALRLSLAALKYTPLQITEHESILIAQLLWSICHYSRFCPFWKYPQVSVSEALLLYITSGQLHSKFVLSLQHVEQKQLLPISDSELKYQIYENDLCNLCPLEDPGDAHLQAMETLLQEKGWSFWDVSNLMTSPLSPRTKSGWLIQQPYLGIPMEYASLEGFTINIFGDNPSIKLLVTFADDNNVGLFSQHDISEALQLQSGYSYFSLDHPNNHQRFHPFQEFRYKPDNLKNSDFLHTLFETDYLLKSFSVGSEISCIPPFKQRPCSDFLINNLPKELQEILKPVASRGESSSKVNRFWIQVDELIYDEKEEKGTITLKLKKPKMLVRTHPLFPDLDGKLRDTIEDEDPNSPEFKFAEDLTRNYDKIGQYFPMFARLRELVKLQYLGSVIHNITTDLKRKSEGIGVIISEHEYQKCLKEDNAQMIRIINNCLNDLKGQCNSKFTNIAKLPYSQQKAAHASLCTNLSSELIKIFQGSATYGTIYSYAEQWLADLNGGVTNTLWNFITQKVSSQQKLADYIFNCLPKLTPNNLKQMVMKSYANTHSRFSLYVSKFNCYKPSNNSSCKWVPAALLQNSDDKNRWAICYGGVMLCPMLTKGKVNLPDGTKSVILDSPRRSFPSSSTPNVCSGILASKKTISTRKGDNSKPNNSWSPILEFNQSSDVAKICDKKQFTSILYGNTNPTSASRRVKRYPSSNYNAFWDYTPTTSRKNTELPTKTQEILLHSREFYTDKFKKSRHDSQQSDTTVKYAENYANGYGKESGIKQKDYQAYKVSGGIKGSTTSGGSSNSGGRGGGGGSGNNNKRWTNDSTWCHARGEKWKEIKCNALGKGQFGKMYYYKVNTDRGQRWFSFDHAGHAGSAFKGFIETRSELVFESSYDHNLQIMANKHESNEGTKIKKCEMRITAIKNSSKKVFVTE